MFTSGNLPMLAKLRAHVAELPLYAILLFPLLGWLSKQSLSLFLLAGCCLLLLLGYRAQVQRGLGQKRLKWILLGVVGFLLLNALGVIFSTYVRASLQGWLVLSTYAALFVILLLTIDRVQMVRRGILILIGVAALICLYGLSVFISRGVPNLRLAANFGWYNTLAGFLLLVLPLALVHTLRASSAKGRLLWLLACWLLGVTFVLTYSRASWIALVLSTGPLLLYVAIRNGWKGTLGKAGLLIGVVLLTVKVLTQSPGWQFFPSTGAEGSEIGNFKDAGKRWDFWVGAGQIFFDHPVVGTGINTYDQVYPAYQTSIETFSKSPHNHYLKIAAEQGLAGLLAAGLVAVFMVWVGWQGLRTWRAQDEQENGFLLACMAGAVASFMHAGLDWDFEVPAIVVPLIVLLIFSYRLSRPELKGEEAKTIAHQTVRPTKLAYGAILLFALTLFLGWGALSVGEYAFAQADRSLDVREEERWMARALFFDPWNDRYLAQQAVWMAESGEQAASLDKIQSALRLNPGYSGHHGLSAQALVATGQLTEGRSAYEQALALDPYNKPAWYVELSDLVYRLEGRAAATEVLEAALRRYPFEQVNTPYWGWEITKAAIVDIYERRAILYDLEGQPERAEALFAQGMQILPEDKGIQASFREFLQRAEVKQ